MESVPKVKYWWMEPNGDLHVVKNEGHAYFAAHYLSTLVGKDPRVDMYKVYDSMYNLGWIRVALFGYMGQTIIRFNMKPDKDIPLNQLNVLKELCKEYDVYELVNDTSGIRYPAFQW